VDQHGTVSLVGQVLGGTYKVERLLGEGGMGAVYTCTNVRLGKRFAVKVLSNVAMAHSDIVHRFQREARIATELGHPHIVEVHDFNQTDDGLPYMVMEQLSGTDLEGALRNGATLPPERAVFIIRQVCSALHGAHAKGIIHRDLKPGNIFLCNDMEYPDFVKVLDFGISKMVGSTSLMTQDASILGTPHFMAPEQAQGKVKVIGPSTDVFALGAILYRMLGGKLPFDATGGPSGLLYQVVHESPPPLSELQPGLSEQLVRVVERAMAKSQADRHPGVRALSADLLAAVPTGTGPLADSPWEESIPAEVDAMGETVAQPAGAPSTFSSAAAEIADAPKSKRNLVAVVVGTVAIAALGAGTAIYYHRANTTPASTNTTPIRVPASSPPDAAPHAEVEAKPDQGLPDGPTQVRITLKGSPKGARVIDVQSKKELGRLPASFSWPASSKPLKLLIKHPRHRRRFITIIPSEDRSPKPIRLRPSGVPDNPHTR
jgi:serine/threonine-protein kinase